MSEWRVAESLLQLRTQVNSMFPNREKGWDGTIGDMAHASRTSDHNPWVKDGNTGVVTGEDITNSPKTGPVSQELAEALVASKDPRIKYVISNKRICAGTDGPAPWTWRPYNGSNPHDHHVHISVKADKAHYDDKKAWDLSKLRAVAAPETKPAPTTAKPVTPTPGVTPPRATAPVVPSAETPIEDKLPDPTTERDRVRRVQKDLKDKGFDPGPLDGIVGHRTIEAFERSRGLTVTGHKNTPHYHFLASAINEAEPLKG